MLQGKPTRRLWIAAIALSVLCVGGLAYAFLAEWNTEPTRDLDEARKAASTGSGFGLGIVVGLGAGIVLGSLLATRRRN